MKRASRQDWDYPHVPMEAYRHAGTQDILTEDPRNKAEYVVLETLGSGLERRCTRDSPKMT